MKCLFIEEYNLTRLHIDLLYLRGATIQMRRSTSGARVNVVNRG